MAQKTPATTTQTNKIELSPEQKQMFDIALPYAKEYASKPLQQFSGTGIAELSPEEKAAQTAYLGTAAPVGEGLAAQAAGAQSKLLDPNFMLDVGNNQYLKNAMDANAGIVSRQLTEQALPAVAQGATMAGGMYSGGSSREGIAQGQAIGRASTAISDSNARMMLDAYNSGLGGLQQAIQANPNVQAQQLFAPDVMATVGAQNRAVEQAKLDEEIRRFYTGQALPFVQAQELMGLISGMPGGTAVGQVTGSTPTPSPFMAGMGGAASGAAIGSIIPGVGTGIGAGVGLLASLLLNR